MSKSEVKYSEKRSWTDPFGHYICRDEWINDQPCPQHLHAHGVWMPHPQGGKVCPVDTPWHKCQAIPWVNP